MSRAEYQKQWREKHPEWDAVYMPAWREANAEHLRAYNRESNRRRYDARMTSHARKLERGERIMDRADQHKGMAKLKEMLGDPRPEGLQLSLINWDSSDAYWGREAGKGGKDYRLSTNPDDYAWETAAENIARRAE